MLFNFILIYNLLFPDIAEFVIDIYVIKYKI